MNKNIQALLEACKLLNLETEVCHSSENLVLVDSQHLFVNWSTPCNSQSAARLCADKDYCYSLLSKHIKMPATQAYLSPYVSDSYKAYLKHDSEQSICGDIANRFSFPLILKPNRGSHGVNVFKISTIDKLQHCVRRIFNVEHKDYDYVVLVQDFIEAVHEYRVIWLTGELSFAYEKLSSMADAEDNISPFRSSAAQALQVLDSDLLGRLAEFLAPLNKVKGLNFCGVDIISTADSEFYLIELNASPGFDFFIRDNGSESVINLYKKMLENFKDTSRY